jgi:hypothetical protein
MLLLRRIDHTGQLILGTLMLLSIPVLYFYGFLAGLFLMGVWQLISASLNTYSFIHSVHRKRIRLYWICCIADLVLIALGWQCDDFFGPRPVQVIYGLAIAGAIGIAVYYLVIYNKFIVAISLRDELDGLTKSKH